MPSVILAVDLGTTSLKCILVDTTGQIIDRESASQSSPAQVRTWIANLVQVVDTLRARNAGLDISAIAVTGQMHGTQLYDHAGQPSGDCAIWTDRSTAYLLPEVLNRLGPGLPLRIGSTIAPGFQALRLFATADLDSYSKALLPKDTLIHFLTGRFVTDPTDAAGTGLFDGGNSTWAWDVVDALEIPRDVLPEIVPSGSNCGPLTPEAEKLLHLPPETPVIIAGGDTPVAALAAGTTSPTDCQMMISTSAQVLIPASAWQPHPAATWYTWPAAGPLASGDPRWLRSGTISNGGSVLQWLRDLTGEIELTRVEPQPILVLPHLAGRRFPVADAAASGAFLGLRASHTRENIQAAVLQGIAFTFREVFEAMTASSERPSRIRLGGGASQTPGFAQVLATVLNRSIERIAGSDLTCEGAAMLAAKWLGWPKREIPTGDIVQPDPSLVDAFNELYPLYLELNATVAPVAQRLHQIAT